MPWSLLQLPLVAGPCSAGFGGSDKVAGAESGIVPSVAGSVSASHIETSAPGVLWPSTRVSSVLLRLHFAKKLCMPDLVTRTNCKGGSAAGWALDCAVRARATRGRAGTAGRSSGFTGDGLLVAPGVATDGPVAQGALLGESASDAAAGAAVADGTEHRAGSATV